MVSIKDDAPKTSRRIYNDSPLSIELKPRESPVLKKANMKPDSEKKSTNPSNNGRQTTSKVTIDISGSTNNTKQKTTSVFKVRTFIQLTI